LPNMRSMRASISSSSINSPALGCDQSFFDSGQEPRFAIEIAGKDILHQAAGISPRLVGDLRYLRFLLGRQIDYHAAQITREDAPEQRQ
jgi:hypothetical protein